MLNELNKISSFTYKFCHRSKISRARLRLERAYLSTDLFEIFLVLDHLNISFKFYKDPNFSYGDACKTMLAFVWSLIFYVLLF